METKPVNNDYIVVMWRVDSKFRRISGLGNSHEVWLKREPVGVDGALSRFQKELRMAYGITWRKMPILPTIPQPRGPKWWVDSVKRGPVIGFRCSRTGNVFLVCVVERSVWVGSNETPG